MSVEEDAKQVVRHYVEAFNRGDMNTLRALLAEEAEIQGVFGKGLFEKIEPIWRQLIEGYGMQLHIQSLIAEGNVVAARYVESGTFRAPAFGHQPTGKQILRTGGDGMVRDRRRKDQTSLGCKGFGSAGPAVGNSSGRMTLTVSD